MSTKLQNKIIYILVHQTKYIADDERSLATTLTFCQHSKTQCLNTSFNSRESIYST